MAAVPPQTIANHADRRNGRKKIRTDIIDSYGNGQRLALALNCSGRRKEALAALL
jgi:hypothetical protein